MFKQCLILSILFRNKLICAVLNYSLERSKLLVPEVEKKPIPLPAIAYSN